MPRFFGNPLRYLEPKVSIQVSLWHLGRFRAQPRWWKTNPAPSSASSCTLWGLAQPCRYASTSGLCVWGSIILSEQLRPGPTYIGEPDFLLKPLIIFMWYPCFFGTLGGRGSKKGPTKKYEPNISIKKSLFFRLSIGDEPNVSYLLGSRDLVFFIF